MPSGGDRGGRKPKGSTAKSNPGFRGWCRAVVEQPAVRKLIEAEARTNPEFALRVAEHGYGRPPQALDVRTNDGKPIVHQVTFGGLASPAGGHPGVPALAGVPAADLRVDGAD